MQSNQAQVAKLCRQYCKSIGIKCTARSKSYSGGDSVNVVIFDQPPAIVEQVEREFDKYQYGHFDGMIDLYEYSNPRDDIPQTKYLFVRNNHSAELRQAGWSYLREHVTEAAELPESLQDVPSGSRIWNEWHDTIIYRLLCGSLDDLSVNFWADYLKPGDAEPVVAGDGFAIEPGTREGFMQIRFDAKPGEDIRAELKTAGFRWSRRNAVWYGRTDNAPSRYRGQA